MAETVGNNPNSVRKPQSLFINMETLFRTRWVSSMAFGQHISAGWMLRRILAWHFQMQYMHFLAAS
jgi:hypothetical protein